MADAEVEASDRCSDRHPGRVDEELGAEMARDSGSTRAVVIELRQIRKQAGVGRNVLGIAQDVAAVCLYAALRTAGGHPGSAALRMFSASQNTGRMVTMLARGPII